MLNVIEMAILLLRCSLSEEMVNLAKALYGLGTFLNLAAPGDERRWLEALHAVSGEWRLNGVTAEGIADELSRSGHYHAVDAEVVRVTRDESARGRLLAAAAAYLILSGSYRLVGRALLMVYVTNVLAYGYGSVGEDQLKFYEQLVMVRLSTKTLVFTSADLVILSYGVGRLARAGEAEQAEVTHA